MLSLEDYNSFCQSLPATTHVVQWGDSHVWKVGGKVFAIAGIRDEGELFVTFKVSEMAWEIFRDAPGVRPAPYLASRGMKWLQRTNDSTMDDEALRDMIRQSYELVAAKLTRKAKAELGFKAV